MSSSNMHIPYTGYLWKQNAPNLKLKILPTGIFANNVLCEWFFSSKKDLLLKHHLHNVSILALQHAFYQRFKENQTGVQTQSNYVAIKRNLSKSEYEQNQQTATSLSGKISHFSTNLNPPQLLTQKQFDALCTQSAVQELQVVSSPRYGSRNRDEPLFSLQCYHEPYLDCRYVSILSKHREGFHFECLVDSFKKHYGAAREEESSSKINNLSLKQEATLTVHLRNKIEEEMYEIKEFIEAAERKQLECLSCEWIKTQNGDLLLIDVLRVIYSRRSTELTSPYVPKYRRIGRVHNSMHAFFSPQPAQQKKIDLRTHSTTRKSMDKRPMSGGDSSSLSVLKRPRYSNQSSSSTTAQKSRKVTIDFNQNYNQGTIFSVEPLSTIENEEEPINNTELTIFDPEYDASSIRDKLLQTLPTKAMLGSSAFRREPKQKGTIQTNNFLAPPPPPASNPSQKSKFAKSRRDHVLSKSLNCTLRPSSSHYSQKISKETSKTKLPTQATFTAPQTAMISLPSNIDFSETSPFPIFDESERYEAARSHQKTVRAVARVSEGIKSALFQKIRELKKKQNEIEQVTSQLINEKKAKYINEEKLNQELIEVTTDWKERYNSLEEEHAQKLEESTQATRSKICSLEYQIEKIEAHHKETEAELAQQKLENERLKERLELVEKESKYLNAQLATKDADYKRRLVQIIQERSIPCFTDSDYQHLILQGEETRAKQARKNESMLRELHKMRDLNQKLAAQRDKEKSMRHEMYNFMESISKTNMKCHQKSYEIEVMNREEARQFCELMKREFPEEFQRGGRRENRSSLSPLKGK